MTTTNYAWSLPIVGGNQNQWGTMLNNILTDIDAKMFARTGGTISGNVLVAGGVSATGAISGSAAGVRLPTASPVYFNAGFTTYIQEVSAGVLQFVVGGTDVTHFSSTGLAVAGSVSATGASSNNQLILERTGSATGKWGIYTHSNSLFFSDNVASADRMVIDASGNLLMTGGGSVGSTSTDCGIRFAANAVLPTNGSTNQDNANSFGNASYRWTTIYATTGAINTSDAREKTPVRRLADAEVEAAKALSKEIGIFQWLDSVTKKGGAARQHVGFTVQRAIEIMESHGLDPMSYAFICHDVWDSETKEVDATEDDDGAYSITATRQKTVKKTEQRQSVVVVDGKPVLKTETVEFDAPVVEEIQVTDEAGRLVFIDVPEVPEIPAVLDDEGNENTPAVAAIPAHQVPMMHSMPVMESFKVWKRVGKVLEKGDRYAFRYDQLNLFIARGIEARLTALEARA